MVPQALCLQPESLWNNQNGEHVTKDQSCRRTERRLHLHPMHLRRWLWKMMRKVVHAVSTSSYIRSLDDYAQVAAESHAQNTRSKTPSKDSVQTWDPKSQLGTSSSKKMHRTSSNMFPDLILQEKHVNKVLAHLAGCDSHLTQLDPPSHWQIRPQPGGGRSMTAQRAGSRWTRRREATLLSASCEAEMGRGWRQLSVFPENDLTKGIYIV